MLVGEGRRVFSEFPEGNWFRRNDIFSNQAKTMHATHEKKAPFGFTLSEVAAASSRPQRHRNPGVENDRTTSADREIDAPKARLNMTPSHRAWCARNAAFRNMPQPPIEQALSLLNHDRLLVENVLNTAQQMGFEPMTIVETILEKRG